MERMGPDIRCLCDRHGVSFTAQLSAMVIEECLRFLDEIVDRVDGAWAPHHRGSEFAGIKDGYHAALEIAIIQSAICRLDYYLTPT